MEDIEALDAPGRRIAGTFNDLVPAGPVKAALDGSWMGHAVHPLLTDVVIGTFMSATLLDLLGGKESQKGANRLVAIGLAAYGPTAVTGLSDWADSADDPAIRRTGLVHAASNAVGASLYAASLKARTNGSRGRGALLGLAGMGAMGAGAFLGGHLTAIRGIKSD